MVTSTTIICATIAWVSIVVILWRAVTISHGLSGNSFRAARDERREWHSLVCKLVEKRDVNPDLAARLHSSERMNQDSLDATVEKASIESQVSQPAKPPEEPEFD